MAGSAVEQLASEAAETMDVALAALKDSRDTSAPAPSRQQLHAAVGLLETEIAKVGLWFHGNASPDPAEAAPLLKGFANAVTLVCMLYTGLTASAGPSLRKAVLAAATSLVEACAALARGAPAAAAARSPGADQQLMLLSGFAIEMCQAAGKAPLDNKTAIGRQITLVLRQLADAEHELGELAEQAANEVAAAAGSGAEAGAGEGSAGEAEEGAAEAADEQAEDGEGEAFSPEQLALARAIQALLAAVTALGKALVRVLLAQPAAALSGGAGSTAEAWESLLFHVKVLGAAADDLAAGVYTQDEDEMRSAAEAVATGAELLVEELPEAGEATEEVSEGSQAQGGDAAQRAELSAALERVTQAHAALLELLA